ncbi:ABC transporter substrate-binding protein [Algihabitans albus]|uniref:ABC transporter substrate-binding protein n=1 Tax=Algihabitans albus TaxID=2164067 RepID=UPI000E5CF533|nr:ABC transporter substrate-binding protein [Algihabitans albus]
MSFAITRRSVLGGLAATAAVSGLPYRAFAQSLRLFGAPIGVSVPLAHLVDRNGLAPLADNATLTIWRSPDEMRAGVVSGAIELTTSPAPTAANLYNRGTGMRLAGVLTTGMLYLMTTRGGLDDLTGLAGQRVLVPFRGDMPDRVFELLLRARGMSLNDVEVQYTATPIEAAQLLLAGQAEFAVLQEPAATASIMRGLAQSVPVFRALDFQQLYAETGGEGLDIPMAVLIMQDSLRDRLPDLPNKLLSELRGSTQWVRNNPASAARLGEDYLGLRQPVLERSIPFMNLSLRTPAQARASLERLYGELAGESAALIGGRLPDDDFYLDIQA